MKKIDKYFIIAILITLVVGGVVLFYVDMFNVSFTPAENQAQKNQTKVMLSDWMKVDELIKSEYLTFSGQIKKIDLAARLINIKLDAVEVFPATTTTSYKKGDTYNFIIDVAAEVFELHYYKNSSVPENGKKISLADLKTGNNIILYVRKAELDKKDNLVAYRVNLKKVY